MSKHTGIFVSGNSSINAQNLAVGENATVTSTNVVIVQSADGDGNQETTVEVQQQTKIK